MSERLPHHHAKEKQADNQRIEGLLGDGLGQVFEDLPSDEELGEVTAVMLKMVVGEK